MRRVCVSAMDAIDTEWVVLQTSGWVVLCFNRNPKELYEALLQSHLADRIIAYGRDFRRKEFASDKLLAMGAIADVL